MKVLYTDSGRYILDVGNRYMLLDPVEPEARLYADHVCVFLRFMPYAKECTEQYPEIIKLATQLSEQMD